MRIDVQELTEQFTKLKTWLADNKEKVVKMNTGITTFVSETEATFQGEAGDGMRSCMTDMFTPLYQQFEVTEQTLTHTVDTITKKAEGYFGSGGIVDDTYLDEWLNNVERVVRDFDYMSDDIDAQVRNINDLISVQTVNRDPFLEPLHTMKRHVAEVKSHMAEFEAEASDFVSQVNIEVSKLTSMLKEVSRVNNDMRTYKSGSFKFSQLSMRRMSEKEQQFLENLQKQYGFDEKTALIMLDAFRKSREYVDFMNASSGSTSQPDEATYTLFFTRLMSSVVYPGLSWTALGGGTGLNFTDTMKAMGMSEEDTLHLKSMLILQYRSGSDYPISPSDPKIEESLNYLRNHGYFSESNGQLYNQFCGANGSFFDKNDFGHQMIVTAIGINNMGGYGGADSHLANISGWLGDTNGAAIGPLSFGSKSMNNGDYKADLDGYNLATDQLADRNKNFLDVTNAYYDRIDPLKQGFDTKTRASEFLYHKGYENERSWGPFGNYRKSYAEMCQQGLKQIDEEYKENIFKKDSYQTDEYKKFIESLEKKSNDYLG